MIKPPCRADCKGRSIEPNCHSTCTEYLDYKAAKAEENKKIQAAKYANGEAYAFRKDRIASARRRRGGTEK